MYSPQEARCVLQHFPHNLRQARLRAGLSQAELAARCDLHRTEVSLIERGGREPRLGVLVKLAAALDADVDALLTPPDAAASR